MFDLVGAILLGVGLATFSLVTFLVVFVLWREARARKLLDAFRTDERILYLVCVKLLSRSDWEVRCPSCDVDLLASAEHAAEQPEPEADVLDEFKNMFLKLPAELQNEIIGELPDKDSERLLDIFAASTTGKDQ